MQEETLASGGFALAWLVKVIIFMVRTVTMLLEKESYFLTIIMIKIIKINMHVYVGLRKRARNARAADVGEAFTIQRLMARLDNRVTGPCVDQALLLALEVARPL